MSTVSLYCGNLPWSCKNEDLQKKFEEFGVVTSARIITDKMTGRSRGFGFVDIDSEDASKAITALNESDFGGRKLTVNEARPRAEMVR